MGALLAAEVEAYAKIWSRRLLPPGLRDRLRARRRRGARPAPVPPAGRAQTAADLRALRLEGRDVLVHSALSALGRLDGGPATLAELILEAIGPEATLLAPAYPMPGTMHEWMTAPTVFDVTRSPSRMGALTEHLRGLPGACRSAHPTHSIVAVGRHAGDYTADHHLSPTPTGIRSPFYRHMRRGGLILCLGSSIGKVTSYHVVEDVVPDFPVDPYLPQPMSKTVILPDGTRHEVWTRVADPALSMWRVDNFKPKEAEILALMRRDGIVREAHVAGGPAAVIDAAGLFAALQRWAGEGVTIYHTPRLAFPRRRPSFRPLEAGRP